MNIVRLPMLLLLASSPAIAQERIEIQPPPLSLQSAPCPTPSAPCPTPCAPCPTPCAPCATPCAPCPGPCAAAPSPSLLSNDPEIHELEESAHAQRFAGHVLMAAGAITAITGIGLLVAGTMSGSCVSGGDPHHASYDCDSWMGFAGALTLFLGLTAFGPGAALHDSAERDLATARSLRRTSTRPWSLAPKVDPHGAAAQFAVAF